MITKENIKEILNDIKMNELDYLKHSEKINSSAFEFYSNLNSFSNNINKEETEKLLSSYYFFKSNLNSFIQNGGMKYKDSNLKIGFMADNKTANFAIDAFIEKVKEVNALGWEIENIESTKLKMSQDMEASKLFDYDEDNYCRNPKFGIKELNKDFLIKNLTFYNQELFNYIQKETGFIKGNLNPQELFQLNNNVYNLIENINNEEEANKYIKYINKVISSNVGNIEESERKEDKKYTIFNEDGTLNPDFNQQYQLMKSEKNTTWLKSNLEFLTPEVLKQINININPVLDFAEEILNSDNRDFELDSSLNLATILFKDEQVKNYYSKVDILNYIKNDFPTPSVFKAMIDSLTENELNEKHSEKYSFVEEVVSNIIGEESSCFNLNENKLACLVNLMNCENFNIEQKLNIETSKNLKDLVLQRHNQLHQENDDTPEMHKSNHKVNNAIPNALIFNGSNKITIMDFLQKAQDHLIIQHENSDHNSHEKDDKVFDSEKGLIIQSVKKDWFDILNKTLPTEDFSATKLKQKILNVTNYFNSWSGPISSLLGFVGVLGCALFLGAAKIVEKSQNDKIRDHLNKFTEEHKISIDEIKTKMNQNGEVEIIAILDGDSHKIAVGKDCFSLIEIKGDNLLQNISTAKAHFFQNFKGLDPDIKIDVGNMMNVVQQNINKYLSNHPLNNDVSQEKNISNSNLSFC